MEKSKKYTFRKICEHVLCPSKISKFFYLPNGRKIQKEDCVFQIRVLMGGKSKKYTFRSTKYLRARTSRSEKYVLCIFQILHATCKDVQLLDC